MENASKALLIAGSVLIVILLIGLGILIYSRSTGVVDTATGIANTQEIQAFNSQFSGYEGKQKGSSVKSLVATIIANNGIYSTGENKRIRVDYYINGEHYDYVNDLTLLSSLSSRIETSKTYNVSFTEYKDGLIFRIRIQD